jgi:HK97 family phage prohead protease
MINVKDAGQRKSIVCPFRFENLTEAGSFTGYGSIFGNEDLGGDVVMQGAFRKFKYTRDKKVRLLYQHDTWQPVGKFTPEQDEKGLFMADAQLVLEMPGAMGAYAGMKSGLLDGLSIGFDILPKGSEYDEEAKVRRLTKLELWEVSIVTFGMNPLAKIQSVKTANNIRTKREFEEFLRESGWSVDAAKKITAAGFKEEVPESQPRDVGDTCREAAERIKSFTIGDQRDVAPVGLKGLMDFVNSIKV